MNQLNLRILTLLVHHFRVKKQHFLGIIQSLLGKLRKPQHFKLMLKILLLGQYKCL